MIHKIVPVNHLKKISMVAKQSNKKVVQCHGVFDPIHIGHIRHFKEAKKLGEILVVTITPDRFVNKGPDRPVFEERLRAESIASLECVDYVSVNDWPTAVEPINLLRPDFFVKGTEYNDPKNDITEAIEKESTAVKESGGQIHFVDNLVFSSSNLLNHHFGLFSEEVSDYLKVFTNKFTRAQIFEYIRAAADMKVLVIGEAIIDEYQFSEALGKSRKEPTLAVRELSLERHAGGILAVANHVSSFSNSVNMIAMLGDNPSDQLFVDNHLDARIQRNYIYKKDGPTIVKRRIVENYHFTKLLEIYNMSPTHLDDQSDNIFCEKLRQLLPLMDATVVVDFGHGMLSEKAIEIICDESRFLAINTQANAGNFGFNTLSKYPTADYLCVAEAEIRLDVRDQTGNLNDLILSVSDRLNCPRIVVTRGKSGALSYSDGQGFHRAPAIANKVVDRIGAGDAFIGISSLIAAQNAPMEIVTLVGNAAGGQAVAQIGNRVSIDRNVLTRHIETLMK